MAATAHAVSTDVTVQVSPDRLRATLTFPGAAKNKTAPKETSEEAVYDALARALIDITDAVKQRVTEFVERVNSGNAEDFVVAEGSAPSEGKDEEFVWTEAFQAGADSWSDGEQINYYETSTIITVEKGDVAGSIAPSEPPRDGVDVTGRVIPTKGEPKALALDPGSFERSEEDPTQLIVKTAGYPVCEDGKLTIHEVLVIAGDIDFECGNIDSTVAVHIKGRVLDRFSVRSKGSITVCAAIEAAGVEAEGNVTVKQGILGHGTGFVSAGGDIVAKFCAEAHLYALGDVKIARQLMASHVCVGRKLVGVGAGVIGGCVYAGGGVEVANLGSDANVPTRIVIGVDPVRVREVAMLHRSIERTKKLVDRITALLAQIKPAEDSLTAEQANCLRDLRAKSKEAQSRLKADQIRHDELLEKVYTDGEHSVVVGDTIYAGTVIRISDRETVFRKNLKGPVTIEKRKLKNITEVVAVNKLTAGVTVLTNERFGVDTLLEGFELEGDLRPQSRR